MMRLPLGEKIVRIIIAGAVSALAVGLLGSCATMSEDQCLAGAWGEQGYKDGADGLPMSRLDDHAQACAKVGVTPNVSAYGAARDDGLRSYCRPERGFVEGREGDTYHGACSSTDEADFLPAYRDGQLVHAAQAEVNEAESEARRLEDRVGRLEGRLRDAERDLGKDDLTEEQKRALRDTIRDIRQDRDRTRREAREARDDVDQAERELWRVRRDLIPIYGDW